MRELHSTTFKIRTLKWKTKLKKSLEVYINLIAIFFSGVSQYKPPFRPGLFNFLFKETDDLDKQ